MRINKDHIHDEIKEQRQAEQDLHVVRYTREQLVNQCTREQRLSQHLLAQHIRSMHILKAAVQPLTRCVNVPAMLKSMV